MSRPSTPRPNLNPKSLPTLALAGRAVLTFRNLETGTHMTCKISQKRDKKDRKIKLPVYNVWISLLGDNEIRMRYAGMIFTDKPTQLRIWLNRAVPTTDRLAITFRWLVSVIQNPESLRDPITNRYRAGIFHEGRCCCCGLPLTHPESVYTGLGPVCLKAKEAAMREQNVEIAELFAPVEQVQA